MIYPIRILRTLIPALNKKPVLKSIVRSIFIFAFTKTPIKKKFPKILFGRNFNPDNELSHLYIEKFKLASQTSSRVNLVFSVHTFNIDEYMKNQIVQRHLLIWGGANKIASLKKHGDYHYNYLKSDEFVTIQNAGHLCMYEKPAEVNQLIESYLLRNS